MPLNSPLACPLDAGSEALLPVWQTHLYFVNVHQAQMTKRYKNERHAERLRFSTSFCVPYKFLAVSSEVYNE